MALDHLCHHVVNQPVLLEQFGRLEMVLPVSVLHHLENILESAILLLHNSVFGRHLEWHPPLVSLIEAHLCKVFDRLICVVHAHLWAWGMVIMDGDSFFSSIFSSLNHL